MPFPLVPLLVVGVIAGAGAAIGYYKGKDSGRKAEKAEAAIEEEGNLLNIVIILVVGFLIFKHLG